MVSLLGKGGFSEVWRAYDLVNLRYVAVKVHQLNEAWSDDKKENYTRHATREYDIHRTLEHHNVVKLHDVFEINRNAFGTVALGFFVLSAVSSAAWHSTTCLCFSSLFLFFVQIPLSSFLSFFFFFPWGAGVVGSRGGLSGSSCKVDVLLFFLTMPRYLTVQVLELCEGGDLDHRLKSMLPNGLPESDARAILLQMLAGLRYLNTPRENGTVSGMGAKAIIHYDLKPGNILFDTDGVAKITDFGLSKVWRTPPELLAALPLDTASICLFRALTYHVLEDELCEFWCGKKGHDCQGFCSLCSFSRSSCRHPSIVDGLVARACQ